MWLSVAETLVQVLEIARKTGTGWYLVFRTKRGTRRCMWSTRLGQFDPQKGTSPILDNLPLIAATLVRARKLTELDSDRPSRRKVAAAEDATGQAAFILVKCGRVVPQPTYSGLFILSVLRTGVPRPKMSRHVENGSWKRPVARGGADIQRRSEAVDGSGGTSARSVRPLTKVPPRAGTLVTLQPELDECLSGNCRILRHGEALVVFAQDKPEEGGFPGLEDLPPSRTPITLPLARLSINAPEVNSW